MRVRLIAFLIIGIPSILFLTSSILFDVMPESIRTVTDSILSATCHQLESRCLQLPWGTTGLCARCTSFWAGLFLASAGFLLFRIRGVIWLGILLIIPLVVDGAFQYFGFYESSNLARILTGFLAGIGLGLIFWPEHDSDSNLSKTGF